MLRLSIIALSIVSLAIGAGCAASSTDEGIDTSEGRLEKGDTSSTTDVPSPCGPAKDAPPVNGKVTGPANEDGPTTRSSGKKGDPANGGTDEPATTPPSANEPCPANVPSPKKK